jgi:hypothetical protein
MSFSDNSTASKQYFWHAAVIGYFLVKGHGSFIRKYKQFLCQSHIAFV